LITLKRNCGMSAAAVLGMAAMVGTVPAMGQQTPIKIGVLAELTGPLAASGNYVKMSAEAFADAKNAAGGIEGHRVEIVVVDTQSKPEQAIAGLRRLANDDGVHFVVCCGTSPTSIAVKPISQQLKIPVIATGQSPDVISPPAEAQWIFRPNLSQEISLRQQLQDIKDAGLKRIAFLGVNNAFGKVPSDLVIGLAPQFGLELVGNQLFENTATDVKAQLALLNSGKPEAILVWAIGPAATLASKNVTELAIKAPIYHSMGAANAEFLRDGGVSVEGNYVAATHVMLEEADIPVGSAEMRLVSAYNKAWQTMHGKVGGEFGRTPWDGLVLLEAAIAGQSINLSDIGASRKAIRDRIEALQNHQALVGVLSFKADDHAGLSDKAGALLKVKNGRFVLAHP